MATVIVQDPEGILPDEEIDIPMKKAPKIGSWFDLGDGRAAVARRIIGDQDIHVVYADRDPDPSKPKLKKDKQRAHHHRPNGAS